MSLIIETSDTYRQEREYIISLLMHDFLGLKYEIIYKDRKNIRITKRNDSYQKDILLPDILFQTPESLWLTHASLPVQPLNEWDTKDLYLDFPLISFNVPIIYGDQTNFARSMKSISLPIDIFGSAFFMLTRYEELVKQDSDLEGRFPAEASISYQEGFLHRPIVNEYIELLWSVMKENWPSLERKQRKFRLVLTHDVDQLACNMRGNPLTLIKGAAGDIIKRRSLGLAMKRMLGYPYALFDNFDRDPFNTFEFIMDVALEVGLKSSFFFICSNDPKTIKRHYDIKHPWAINVIRKIHARGHNVEFHPSNGTCMDLGRLENEYNKFAAICNYYGVSNQESCGRQHRLQWVNPNTWSNYDRVGLSYDSTLSFPEVPGFRCGICYEYQTYDLLSQRTLHVRERPLIVMDTTLFTYMKCGFREATEWVVKLCEACKLYHGDFIGLWHNSKLITREQQVWYRELISALV